MVQIKLMKHNLNLKKERSSKNALSTSNNKDPVEHAQQ